MARCLICGRADRLVSAAIGVCADCLRTGSADALEIAQARRRELRQGFGLPEEIPRGAGAACLNCANACRLGEGELGYCGVRVGAGGQVVAFPEPSAAAVEWYLDPLPTNCVAAWACAATGAGYPRFACSPTGERGYYNLAVFYNGCNFDCLFCQNWHHRYRQAKPRMAEELARAALSSRVACVCFFGGDPAPHAQHALAAARRATELRGDEGLRICWETNGAMARSVLDEMIELSMVTGGTIKFDLKAWSEPLHMALCGVSNRATLRNFRRLAEAAAERDEPPLAAASTLLVPGYVDAEEVRRIAEFIASVNPRVPYSLLAFHPDYAMDDLPPTRQHQADECYRAAVEAGLERVRIGNVHLLW